MVDQHTPRIGAIAVIGLACRVPGADTAEGMWENLVRGVESIRRFTRQDLIEAGVDPVEIAHPTYVPAKGVLDRADHFDAALFGYAPREASLMDPQHRVTLECAWEALEHGGHGAPAADARVAVYAGVALNTYLLRNVFPHRGTLAAEGELQLMVCNDKDFVPTRISYQLNLAGPSINVQTACSTSLVAVQMACQSLLAHQCDMALAGGSAVTVPLLHGYIYREGGILSADGHCRPFDVRAGGTVPGNGTGMVLLKRLEDALADGDTVHAVIAGAAVNNDGADKIGYTAPSIAGQAAVIAQAHSLAGVSADSIGYAEAHGTGTPLGDPIEVAALSAAFRRTSSARGYCALGSVKANIGHLDTAAGIIGLIKTVLAVKTGVIPPCLHFERPNPALQLESSPFYVPTTAQSWSIAGLRRACVSSFGIGGTNAHLVIEEAPALAAALPEQRRVQLLCISARTPDALEQAAARLAPALESAGASLADAAFTLARGRRAFPLRRAIVANTVAEASGRLQLASPAPPFIMDRPVAWMFPGQGAQYLGMGTTLAQQEPEYRRAQDEAAVALLHGGAPDVRKLISPGEGGSEVLLTRTENAQLAIFAMEYALARLWTGWGVKPDAVLGHSVGEFAAAVIAGVMTLEDAARLVAARGRLMQALPAGAMLALHCGEEEAKRWLRPGVSLSAINAPGACVLGGSLEAIDRLEQEIRQAGIESRKLHTSHAFHTQMMDPMLEAFRAELASVKLRPPGIPWVSSMTGTWMSAADAVDSEYWVRQVRSPVRFSAALNVLLKSGERALLELGPGNTLTMLARQQTSPAHVLISACGRAGLDEAGALTQAAGSAWACGVALDWERYYAAETRRRVALPAYPFERGLYWINAPTGRESAASGVASGTRMYLPGWRTVAMPESLDASGRWLILGDEHGLGAALAALVRQAGAEVRMLSASESIRAGVEDYARWLSEARPAHVVHLCSLSARESAQQDDDHLPACGYVSVLALSQALARHSGSTAMPVTLSVVSSGIYEVSGQDVVFAAKALMLGPVRVLSQEHPQIKCRLVDLGSADACDERAGQLLAECLAPIEEGVVAHRGRQRWVPVYEELPAAATVTPALRQGGVYLITGGLGALGLRIARHLHLTTGARLVLTGRRPVPHSSEWPALVSADEELVTFDIGDEIGADIGQPPLRLNAEEIGEADEAAALEMQTLPITAEPALARLLDRFCVALLCECFGRAGVTLQSGEHYTLQSLAASLGVVARYMRFLEFMIGVLADEGVFLREGETLTVCAYQRASVAELKQEAIADFAPLAPVFMLLENCAAHYQEILRGAVDGVSVLYPEGRTQLVEAGVAALAGRTRHAHYGRVLGRLLRRSAGETPGPLRVLEVGGGNRFLTREILPFLVDAGIEYWFTDVSRAFIDGARRWAAEAGYPQLKFGVLDISRDTRAQGWSVMFDAVIGLDVVHATRDIEATLRQLRTLIAPGGSLHLVETLPPARWNTMVWGVAEDWWGYSDRLRSSSPLLSVAQWTQALVAAGFASVGSHSGETPGDCALVFGQRPVDDAGMAEVLALQADVTDEAQMAAVVARAHERFGVINAVIHAAGVEGGGALALQSADAAASGLLAKVRGTRVLERVLRDEPLDFLMLCSSVTSLLGGVGTLEYTAANAFLDAFAHERSARGYPVVSVNWDRWRGLGMAATIEARHLAHTGEQMAGGVSAEEALACFDVIAAAPRLPQLIVAPYGFDEARRKASREDVTALAERMQPAARHPRPFMATPFVAPCGEFEQRIAAVWQEALGVDEIGADDDFHELGGDSLIAIKVTARLREVLGLALGVAVLFDTPTVARLANHVEALRWAGSAAPTTAVDLEEGEL